VLMTLASSSVLRTLYRYLLRLHDLWILLGWAGIIAAIMLNTFYNRNCVDFLTNRNINQTCQSGLDLVFFFMAAVGAGIAVSDDRVALVGFIPAHVGASLMFIAVLILPTLLGLADVAFLNIILTNAIAIAFASQIPFAAVLSFIGAPIGVYIGNKLYP